MWKFLKSSGDVDLITAVGEHVERYIGKIDTVLHEKVSPTIHVDVNVVLANEQRPYHSLITSGMAELPMRVPGEIADGRFAELMICLPKEWPLDPTHFKDENFWWPIRQLKSIARFPHENKTWLYKGHTIINEDEEAFASGTKMCSVMLTEPRTISANAYMIDIGRKKKARLWALVPLYKEELQWKLQDGFEPILERFDQLGINEVLDPSRVNVAIHQHQQ